MSCPHFQLLIRRIWGKVVKTKRYCNAKAHPETKYGTVHSYTYGNIGSAWYGKDRIHRNTIRYVR